MNNLYEILETCLQEIEQGADMDTVLFHYPAFADELRPILEASVKAREMAVPGPSSEVVQRNRAKVLQRSSEIREAKIGSRARRVWSVPLRRSLVTLMIVAMLFISSTGLVRAASTTVPGDNLYPVKRTWEDVVVLLTFNPQAREVLQVVHENERLDELNELFEEGRSEKVEFAGYVSLQNATEWQVSGISVIISPQTILPDPTVAIGDPVRVVGQTQNNKTVLAERIDLLSSGSKLPGANDNGTGINQENNNGSDQSEDQNSNTGPETETQESGATGTPKVESASKDENFGGVVNSIDDKNNIWTINGLQADISNAEIKGKPVIGSVVKVEGYFSSNGIFIVKKIEVIDNSSNISPNDNNTNGNNSNSNDNGNDDHGGKSGSGGGGGNGNDGH